MPNFLRFKQLGTFGLFLLSFLLLVSPALAQDAPVTDDDVNAVAKDLFCPVCESTPLDVCPTQACADWRALIREQLIEGQSPEEIQAYFARQYGDGVLANPPKRGFNLIIWLFLVGAIVLGGALFSRYVRSLRTPAVETVTVSETAVPPSPNNDYEAQVEEALRNR